MTAGKLLEDLPALWKKAGPGERKRILMTMLDAVYVDTVEEKRIVAIRPKPAFRPLFEIATTREGSGIVLVTEKRDDEDGQVARTTEAPPPGGQGADELPCSWWRRGRVGRSQFANDFGNSPAWPVIAIDGGPVPGRRWRGDQFDSPLMELGGQMAEPSSWRFLS